MIGVLLSVMVMSDAVLGAVREMAENAKSLSSNGPIEQPVVPDKM